MRVLFAFLLGTLCGAFAFYVYTQRPAPEAAASEVADRAKSTATAVKDAVSEKLTEWKLTPEDLKQDLARGGQIVRSKAAIAGERVSDARIRAVVNAKYVLDRDLSAADVNVDCRDGAVTLRGPVASPELVGRAMALALDTAGVRTVTSALTVEMKR